MTTSIDGKTRFILALKVSQHFAIIAVHPASCGDPYGLVRAVYLILILQSENDNIKLQNPNSPDNQIVASQRHKDLRCTLF